MASNTRARSAITLVDACRASRPAPRATPTRPPARARSPRTARAPCAARRSRSRARWRTRRAARRARRPSRRCAARTRSRGRRGSRARRQVGGGDELAVGLVEHDEQIARHPVEEAVDGVAVDARAGRVVRVAHEHEAGAVGDGVGHGVEVVAVVGERHLHHRGADLHGEDRVRLERRPPEDRPRRRGRTWRRAPCGRARPTRSPAAPARASTPYSRRELLAQRGGGVVGIAVHARRRPRRSRRAPTAVAGTAPRWTRA